MMTKCKLNFGFSICTHADCWLEAANCYDLVTFVAIDNDFKARICARKLNDKFLSLSPLTGLWIGLRATKATLDSAKFVFFYG
jgi:hypothetical protein